MKQPDWKSLERHPLSAGYEDINGEIWTQTLANLKEFGIVDREITLFEDKVLDGYQLQRACVMLDIKPTYKELPEGIPAEKFIEIKNDCRRQTPEEAAIARILERRERIAKARVDGKSLRTIAENEGVSEKTVRNDLKTVTAEGGYAVTPPDGKITGKDDRQQPATKPKAVCPRCRRVGIVKDCPTCTQSVEAMPAAKPTKPKSGKPKFIEKKFDQAYGALVRIVDERGNAMGKGPHHRRCQEILGEFLTEYKLWKKETA